MKRLILPILLLCLLLCGCGETDHPHENPDAVVQPTEPQGCYAPDSQIESLTGGAVRSYTMEAADTYGFAVMGEDVLVFSGTETTKLTRLSGENLFKTAETELDVKICPEEPSVRITEKGVVYFDPGSFELVILDSTLTETERIEVPTDLNGTPILSSDRNHVFYCTAAGLYCLDLEDGINRLVKELSYSEQCVTGVLLNDSVVCCRVTDENGKCCELFCSAENGKTLYTGEPMLLTTWGDHYFAAISGTVMQSFAYGAAEESPWMLVPSRFDASGWYLEERMQFVSAVVAEDTSVVLEQYDLTSGKRLSQVTLPGTGCPLYVEARTGKDQLYILALSAADGSMILYRWDMPLTSIVDGKTYTSEYYSDKNPDTEGLAECRVFADEIGERHGVRILFGDEGVAAQPWDYHLEPQYQVPVLMREMQTLDQLLSCYPQDFLRAAAEGTGDVITICLVDSITGRPESGSLEVKDGLQFRHEDKIFVALTVGSDLQKNLYHEMYYAIETRLLSSSNDCYQWDNLNPRKFSYDYDYEANANRSTEQYLTGKNRYFVDTYSMYSPSEDRARIMQYAMTPGNEEVFQSEYMQKKLKTLCTGIRESFGMKKSPESFLWEQYLGKSLAYTE